MSESEIPWFGQLFDKVLHYDLHNLYADVLAAWAEKARPAIADLARFRTYAPGRLDSDHERFSMWNLYALGRVNDLLLVSLEDAREAPQQSQTLTVDQYVQFFEALGFAVRTPHRFTAFDCEIVRARPAVDPAAPPRIVAHDWPALSFGELQFSRAGVEIVAGGQHVDPRVAESSTLYFTFRRLHRRTRDLSMGWGSNSQWRTSFRRDYRHGNKLIYNADGKNSLHEPAGSQPDRDGLTNDERRELCRHRCFIRTQKRDDDLWPYDDRLEEPTQPLAA